MSDEFNLEVMKVKNVMLLTRGHVLNDREGSFLRLSSPYDVVTEDEDHGEKLMVDRRR